MLSPARGASFRGLEHSQIAFFRTIFVNSSSCYPGTLCFQIFSENTGPNGTPKSLKNEVKNKVNNLRFLGPPKISRRGKVEGDLGSILGLELLEQTTETTDRNTVASRTVGTDHRPKYKQPGYNTQQTSP